MAVDEALMHSVGARADSHPVLRLYQWNEPTLSLGYFQKIADRIQHSPSADIPMVRRNSGGGAIIHDLELTYSFTIHESHPLAKKSTGLYELTHQSLVKTLRDFGLQPVINEKLNEGLESRFLCFQRRAPNDVILDGHKICGSAQRKKFHSISQHGSIILQASSYAPEIIGINDISHIALSIEDLKSGWLSRFSRKMGFELTNGTLSEQEAEQAKEIEKVKFSTIKWGARR